MSEKYKVVDLFAGAGGLSLGFMQTGKYDIKVAFENNPNMQKTYKRNHPGVDVRGNVCTADYNEIQSKYGKIDVVIGGPPCQGFSNANRQKNHAISQNNMLVKQYIRAILELQPKAFVMENVSMLRSEVHRFYLDESDARLLDKYNIPMEKTKIILLEKKFIFDGMLDIVKKLESINKYLWSEEHYALLNVIYKSAKNPPKMEAALIKHRKKLLEFAEDHIIRTDKNGKENKDKNEIAEYILSQASIAFSAVKNYYEKKSTLEELQIAIEPSVMLQRMLSKAKEIFDNHLVVDDYNIDNDLVAVIRSYAVFDYLKAVLGNKSNNYAIKAQVLCAANYGVPQKRMRFVIVGIKKDLSNAVEMPVGRFTNKNYRTVRDAIEDLEDIPTVTNLEEDTGTLLPKISVKNSLGHQLRDAECLFNHIITKTTPVAMERFRALKQGQNFHSLDESLKTNTYTDITRTQNTIYLRLDYDQPSGTVLNVRKSMWVHPILDRAISVREAARLQTFPDSFIFCGTKDMQYQQVGNAVPPIMAKAIAEDLALQLKKK